MPRGRPGTLANAPPHPSLLIPSPPPPPCRNRKHDHRRVWKKVPLQSTIVL